jgi:RecA-family ATPase
MAGSIARGVDWRGRRVRKGRVIVIAAEGGGGYGKRIKAYCQHHQIEMRDLDIGVITAAPNFLEAEDISEVVASIVAAGGASLLIVDTFAQVTPGANENAGEDMGLALKNARGLREATGAMCLLIHHAGKDAARRKAPCARCAPAR